jgi:ion channel-forming bestrophin family protein
MYISKHIGLIDFIARYWKVELVIIVTVSAATAIYIEVLHQYLQISMLMVSGLGTALSFFIAFFTAQAYDRWWEARKIWGDFVNDSRSFARMVMTLFRDPVDRPEVAAIQERLIRRHIAYLYAVKLHLRREPQEESLAYLGKHDAGQISGAANPGNALLELQGRDIDASERAGHIDVIRMAQLNDMLSRFSTSMGMAERIKFTVFPPYYASLIQISLWVLMLMFPVALSEQIGYAAIPSAFLMVTIFYLIFLTGRGLLNPFEGMPTDTPMSSIVRTIEINLLQQLGEANIPPPLEPVDGKYLM